MRYLITTTDSDSPFLTKWFDADNHFSLGCGMVVYDLVENEYTVDGENWIDIEIDHL